VKALYSRSRLGDKEPCHRAATSKRFLPAGPLVAAGCGVLSELLTAANTPQRLRCMNGTRAREILQALVEGTDPFTGEELAPGTLFQHADVLRALLVGIHGIDDLLARNQRRAQLPQNIGRSWSEKEQKQLIDAFEAGEGFSLIAERHGRTVRAIESRLEKLGLLKAGERQTKDPFGSSESH
jgi:hypothetical protein